MNSSDIKKLLSDKHSKDVFIPECKDGPTQGTTHFRLDAWAMARSWSNPTTWGYEIKVSRNDFLRDEKWHNYLDYCSDFYFVCPPNIIQPDEIPVDAGLLWVSKNAKRLYTKKKAPRRKVEIPESLFRYILMCRTRVEDEVSHKPADTVRYWKEFVDLKKEKMHLGYLVSKKIRDYVSEVERENNRLANINRGYDNIKNRIVEMGFDPDENFTSWEFTNKLDQLCGEVSVGFRRNLGTMIDNLKNLQEKINEEA